MMLDSERAKTAREPQRWKIETYTYIFMSSINPFRARRSQGELGARPQCDQETALKSSRRAAMRPVSDWSMIARARRVAATMSRPRMRCLTRGMLRGAIDRLRRPRPSRRAEKRGSPAISPQTLTGMPQRRLDRELDQPQHRRMERVVEMRHLLVAAVDRQRVLDQIIGADREEIGLGGERVSGQCGTRHLDHRA